MTVPSAHGRGESLARRWVRTWQKASRKLAKIRKAELKKLDTKSVQKAMLQLSDALEDAIARFPSRKSSGLVEQQAWFKRLRR